MIIMLSQLLAVAVVEAGAEIGNKLRPAKPPMPIHTPDAKFNIKNGWHGLTLLPVPVADLGSECL